MPAGLATPDWAKGLVWYQVFPERFANAQPANDPQPERGIFLKDWRAPWEAVELEELESARLDSAAGYPGPGPGAGAGSRALTPRTSADVFNAVVFRRRYGGDLQGVLQRIDHLRTLGVTGVYLTPIFRARSLHKYDASDFRHIDEAFAADQPPPAQWPTGPDPLNAQAWPWTPADLFVRDQFVPALKRAGFRVLFDGVWNHVGRDHWAFRDVYHNGQSSPFASWFDATFAGPASPQNPFPQGTLIAWKGWDRRNGSLPAFRQVPVEPARRVAIEAQRGGQARPESAPLPRQTDLAPGPKQHVFDVTARWMRPAGAADPALSGVDGWRLDVAADVGLPFWRDWRAHVKALNPDALLVAEIWFPAWDYFNGIAFDSQMNYPFARAVTGFVQAKPRLDAARFVEQLNLAMVNHPAVELVQMNVLTSHDTDRLSSLLWNSPSDYDSSGGLGPTSTYRTTRPPRDVEALVELAVAMQATLPGAPMIYNGEELGMYGADDPHNRKPIPWPDLDQATGPRADPQEAAQEHTRAMFARWFNLRQRADVGPALRLGAIVGLRALSPRAVTFDRVLGDRVVRVVINRGDDPVKVPLHPQAQPVVVADASAPEATTALRSASVWTWRVSIE